MRYQPAPVPAPSVAASVPPAGAAALAPHMKRLRVLRRGDPAGSIILPRELLALLMDALPPELADAPAASADAEPFRYDPARDRSVNPPIGFDADGRPRAW